MHPFKFNVTPKIKSKLDINFSPAILANMNFESHVMNSKNYEKIEIGIQRQQKSLSVYKTVVFNENHIDYQENMFYLERLVKSLLWLKGGYIVYFKGPYKLGEYLQDVFSRKGKRSFDVLFMERIYENEFQVIILNNNQELVETESAKPVGRHLDGYRIGFDAGGSDRKVSAVVNGKTIFSEEVIWHPKTNSDPMYHIKGIKDSILRAASKMPQVDGIGVSSAGVYIDN
jgi:hypothetical protein